VFRVEDELAKIEQMLDEYRIKLGCNIKRNQDIDNVLNYSFAQLQALTIEDCAIYAFLLEQYSMYIQQEWNRHSAKKKWAEHNLNVMVGKYGDEYGNNYTKFEEKKFKLIADNSYAQKLSELIRETSVVCEDLSFIAMKVGTQSQHLQELRKSKK
jgi:hypothetical protein